jgi:hypothetical protein
MSTIRKANGLTIINSKQTALVASEAGGIELLMPAKNRNLSRMEQLLAAVALHSSDESWVEQTLKILDDKPQMQ